MTGSQEPREPGHTSSSHAVQQVSFLPAGVQLPGHGPHGLGDRGALHGGGEDAAVHEGGRKSGSGTSPGRGFCWSLQVPRALRLCQEAARARGTSSPSSQKSFLSEALPYSLAHSDQSVHAPAFLGAEGMISPFQKREFCPSLTATIIIIVLLLFYLCHSSEAHRFRSHLHQLCSWGQLRQPLCSPSLKREKCQSLPRWVSARVKRCSI